MILVAHLEEKKMGKNLRVVYRLIYLSLTRKVQLIFWMDKSSILIFFSVKTNFILLIVTLNSFNLHFLLCLINKRFMNNCFCVGSTNLTFFSRWIPLDILFCLFILLTFTNEALHLLIVGLNQRSHAIVCLKCKCIFEAGTLSTCVSAML